MTEQLQSKFDSRISPLQDLSHTLGDDAITDVPKHSVEMFPDGASRTPVSAAEALTLDEKKRAERFGEDYARGVFPTKIVKDAWTGVQNGEPGFVVYHRVERSQVESAGVPLGQFTDGKFQHPGESGQDPNQSVVQKYAEMLSSLVSAQQRQDDATAYYGQQPQAVERLYKDDLDGVEQREVGLEMLHQAFDLTDSVEGVAVGSIRVLNFTETQLTAEHMEDLTKALKYVAERSGGAVYDNFDNIVFVPKDHPSLLVPFKRPDGTTGMAPRRGYMAPRTLVMSEWVLSPPEEQPRGSEESVQYFQSLLRPGESLGGEGTPVVTVAQGRFAATAVHEMTHMALIRNDMPETRSIYSRVNSYEHDAELSAAQFLGEGHLVEVTDDQCAEFERKWAWLRSKAKQDGRPQGEHFVRAQEYDLSAGPLPRRLKDPGKPLPVEVTYRLVEDELAVSAATSSA